MMGIGIETPSTSAAKVGPALTAATMMVARFPAVVPKKIRIQNKAITSPHSRSHVLNLAHMPSGFKLPGLNLARL